MKKNGFLVFCTCTINKEENQENVQWFLQKFPNYECCFEEQILPVDGKQDGFFISKLVLFLLNSFSLMVAAFFESSGLTKFIIS